MLATWSRNLGILGALVIFTKIHELTLPGSGDPGALAELGCG